MCDMYYDLPGYIPFSKDLVHLPRTKVLLEAIDAGNDFTLVKELVNIVDHVIIEEVLVIDIKTHDIPSHNNIGILFNERLALIIPCDPKVLIKVFALRKDFPVTIHQNVVSEESPCDLCLYGEPVTAVLRTWTPHRFLQRIQWWLARAARKELHAPDQELEPLFYNSRTTVVLPYNFDALRSDKFLARLIKNENGEHETLRVVNEKEIAPDQRRFYLELSTIKIVMPPVIHGPIEKFPSTLGKLAHLLLKKGGSLYEPLKDAILQYIPEDGRKKNIYEHSIILVCTPIKRNELSEAERIDVKGFFVPYSISEIGIALNLLNASNGVISKGYIIQETGAGIESLLKVDFPIHPLEVIMDFSSETGRIQSGIDELGPKGVIIGAGTLGSAIINIWLRSGWGRWTVIDNDYIKPHNLARHIAFNCGIPEPL